MKSLIDFSNLPDNLSIKLKDNFRKKLFNEFRSKFNNIRECTNYLDCLTSSFYEYKHQNCFIPLPIVRKMTQVCKIVVGDVNKNILLIKKRNSKSINITLPLFPTTELATIIAHTFGDGHISCGGRLEYANKESKLIEDFKVIMKKIFHIYPTYFQMKGKDKKCVAIRYPSTIGELLVVCGAIKGNKTEKKFDVPAWIKSGPTEVKIAFIRALFDDEGSVTRRKSIRIGMSKIDSEKQSLKKFFLSVKKMLVTLGIKTNEILDIRIQTNKSGKKKVKLIFLITGYVNLKQFYEKINFIHPLKSKRLKDMVNSYKTRVYQINEARDIILNLLKNNKKMTTEEISQKISRHKDTVLYHLKKLIKENKVKFSKDINNTIL